MLACFFLSRRPNKSSTGGAAAFSLTSSGNARLRLAGSAGFTSSVITEIALDIITSINLRISSGGARVAGHELGDNTGKDIITLNLEQYPESAGRWTKLGVWSSTGLVFTDDMGWESWQDSEFYDEA